MTANLLLWIVTALYVGQACVYLYQGQYALAMVIGGYSFANIGLILSA